MIRFISVLLFALTLCTAQAQTTVAWLTNATGLASLPPTSSRQAVSVGNESSGWSQWNWNATSTASTNSTVVAYTGLATGRWIQSPITGVAVGLTTATVPTTGNSVVNKTALDAAISTNRTRSVYSKSDLPALTGLSDGAIVVVAGTTDPDGASTWKWSASSTASTNVDTIATTALSTGRFARAFSIQTPVRQSLYSIYSPTVTRGFVLDSSSSPYKYNHDASLAWFGDRWFAQWNANTNQLESNAGQVNLQSTSTDLVTWSTPEQVFISATTSTNPVYFNWSTDLQWQPSMVNVGSELWSLWMNQVPGTYPTGWQIYFSRLTSPTAKWQNTQLNLNYTENGMTFYGFPTQNPLQLQSGRVVAPLVWVATNFVSPAPSGWPVGTVFWTQEKRAGVIYTDDGGSNWKVGGTTTLPGYNYVTWEPTIQQSEDGTIRMYCRNLDYINFSASQYVLTAVGASDGQVFGPLSISAVETTSSRIGSVKQYGKFSRQLSLMNDWKGGGFVTDRYNGAVAFSRSGSDDFILGAPFSGTDTVVSYPQGVVKDDKISVIYSQGSVPRSIKTAIIDPAPDPSSYYLIPRQNDTINPYVSYVAGPPEYFLHTTVSTMYSVATSAGWTDTNRVSLGAWLYRTNNAAVEAYFDNRNVDSLKGLLVASLAGVPYVNVQVGSTSTNVFFSTLSIPTNGWSYLGITIDLAASGITLYVVDSAGSATTETRTLASYNGVNGSIMYVGRSRPGSSVTGFAGRIRHAMVITGVAASANNHRYWHGLDQSALGASDWTGTETNPGLLYYDYWAASSNAGSNDAAWLANWAPTGNALRGNAYSSTVGGLTSLVVTGTGSAGVELPPFKRGEQLQFGTKLFITNKTSGFDQILATIGTVGSQVLILSRTNNPTSVEMWSQANGGYYTLGSYVTNQWTPLSVTFDGASVTASWNNGAPMRALMYQDAPRLFVGQGYLGTRTVNPRDGLAVDVASTWNHVGQKMTPNMESAPQLTSAAVLGTLPTLSLIDTDVPTTNLISANATHVYIGQTAGSGARGFSVETASGNTTAAGEAASARNVINSYGQTANTTVNYYGGTNTSPTAPVSGVSIGAFFVAAYDGASVTSARSTYGAETTENWSVGANGTRNYVEVTGVGSATRRKTWYWESNGGVTHTDAAPVLNATATDGSSGYILNITGGTSSNMLRFQDAGVTKHTFGANGSLALSSITATNANLNGDLNVIGGFAMSNNAPVLTAVATNGSSGFRINVLGGFSSTVRFQTNSTTTHTFGGDGSIVATGPITATKYTSTVATGTAPLTVASTTRVPNLNADMIDGLQKTGIQPANQYLTNVAALTAQSLPSTIISVTENTQTGTTYTVLSTDNGKVVTLNNGSAITVTVPTLSAGFSCTFVQKGAGQVTFTASGTTISNAHSQTKTFGQYAVVTLYGLSSTAFVLAGDTGI